MKIYSFYGSVLLLMLKDLFKESPVVPAVVMNVQAKKLISFSRYLKSYWLDRVHKAKKPKADVINNKYNI